LTENSCISFTYNVERYDFTNAGSASSEIKNRLKTLGLPSDIIRKIAVASYEAEINVTIHAHGGEVILKICEDQIHIQVRDIGPGIEDIELAMKEGYTTATDVAREHGFGAGMGLPNIERFCDEMKIESEVGKGTVIDMLFNI